MHLHFTYGSLILLITSIISLLTASTIWRRRWKTGGWPLFWLMLSIFEWSFAAAVEGVMVTEAHKILWSQIEYIGYVNISAFFLLFVWQYTHQTSQIPFQYISLLWIMPVITLVMAWTNQYHGLLWNNFTPGPAGSNNLIYGHGPWFWVFAMFSYMTAIIGVMILLSYSRTAAPPFRRQLWTFATATIFPFISAGMYISGINPLQGMDISPIGFATTGVIITWCLYRYELLDLVPVGRAVLIEHLPEGMIVLDEKLRIVDCNPAAIHFIGLDFLPIGCHIDRAFSKYPKLIECLSNSKESRTELQCGKTTSKFMEVRAYPLNDKHRSVNGTLVMLRDITDQRLLEAEREHMISELKEAFAQLKTLRGLLPICSYCKKIRDDSGYWNQLEEYLQMHSEAEFSHSICPDCFDKYFPSSGHRVPPHPID